MAQEKKQSFIKGAAILSASTLLVKILGLLFSIPLANTITMDAMSDFYTAYDIFGFLLILSTSGLPIAVSRMVGTAYSRGQKKEADRVFSVAFWLFFSIGLLGCLVMLFFSQQIADVMSNSGANYAIMALAPTMFFISIMSALRGYFQGRSNMVPTALSQIIEAVSKVIIGIGLAVFILQQYDSDKYAAVGAIIGISISAGLGTLYLVIYKIRQRRIDRKIRGESSPESISRKLILRNLVAFAVPITIGACFLSLLDLADNAILMNRLQTAAGFAEEQARSLRGVLGNARKFFDLPGSFVVPISTSLLPVLSAAVANRDWKGTRNMTSISMRVTLLISIPATVGMTIFAYPISSLLLLNNPEAAAGTAPLLAMLSVAIMFNSVLFTSNAILQSLGKPNIPVINMAVGGVIKVALSFFLVSIPEINVMGSAVSTVVSYLLIMVLNLIALRKNLPEWDGFWKLAAPCMLSAAVMGGVSYGVYYVLTLLVSPKIAVLPAIVVAVGVYLVCALLFKAVRYEDVIMMPKGETLVRLLRMKKPDAAPVSEQVMNTAEFELLPDEALIGGQQEEILPMQAGRPETDWQEPIEENTESETLPDVPEESEQVPENWLPEPGYREQPAPRPAREAEGVRHSAGKQTRSGWRYVPRHLKK